MSLRVKRSNPVGLPRPLRGLAMTFSEASNYKYNNKIKVIATYTFKKYLSRLNLYQNNATA